MNHASSSTEWSEQPDSVLVGILACSLLSVTALLLPLSLDTLPDTLGFKCNSNVLRYAGCTTVTLKKLISDLHS